MPEGLEVFFLGKLLREKAGVAAVTHGKHLYVDGQDWTFGLSGRVRFDGKTLHKVNSGRIYGDVVPGQDSKDKLGVDFATGSVDAFREVVTSVLARSRGKLGPLLLDQSVIAGIGVAWGSEILHVCSLDPSKPSNAQDLSGLPEALCRVRDMALSRYDEHVTAVDGWFDSLYAVRHMEVYKKGKGIDVGGRTWWMAT